MDDKPISKINHLRIEIPVLDIAHIQIAEQIVLGMGLRADQLDVDISVHSKFPSVGISPTDQAILDDTLKRSAALVVKAQAIDVTPPTGGTK